jgi:hypothetical protein
MTLATSQNAGLELAKALGLNTSRLVSFSVHVRKASLIEVTANYYAEAPVDGVLEQFERHFKLVEKDKP